MYTHDQLSSAGIQGVESLQALARTQLAALAQLTALNVDLLRAGTDTSVSTLKSLFSARRPEDVLKLVPATAQPVFDHVATYVKGISALSSETQGRLSELIERHAAAAKPQADETRRTNSPA